MIYIDDADADAKSNLDADAKGDHPEKNVCFYNIYKWGGGQTHL